MSARGLGLVAGLVGLLVATSACQAEGPAPGDPSRSVTGASTSTECPEDVSAVVLAEHSCGYVTVTGGARLFWVRVEPPTPSRRAPVVETGLDLGVAPDYAGLAPVAQRTDRPLVIVDLRGTGHSTPSLACPEVDEVGPSYAADPAGSTVDLTAAVARCRSRLEAEGAGPGEVDLVSTAEDLHAVTQALGLDKVVASAHGTTGTAALEWARRHPADLEALTVDTPVLAGGGGAERLHRLVGLVATFCEAAEACATQHPALEREWRRALAIAARQPQLLERDGVRITLDAAALHAAVRWTLAGGAGVGPGDLPDLIREAATEAGPLLGRYADLLLGSPPLCVGQLPKCTGAKVAMGAVLALNCPLVGEEEVWHEPCAAWGSPPLPRTSTAVTTPTLVLTGRLDPFTPPVRDLRRALGPVAPDAFVVQDPAGGHNVLGGDCLRSVRTSWLNGDVRQPPSTPACLGTRTPFDR